LARPHLGRTPRWPRRQRGGLRRRVVSGAGVGR